MKSKETPTIIQQTVQEKVESKPETTSSSSVTTTSKSLWRMFSEEWLPASIVPTNILGVPVVDIQSDLREGTTQISDFFSGLFGSGVDAPPKQSITSTNDQMAPAVKKQEHNIDKYLPIEQSNTESVAAVQSSSTRQGSSILTDDDNRLQAYGWSLSSKNQLKVSDNNGKVQVNVPVYCRPIFNTNEITQIWCAVGIDLSGSSLNVNDTSVDQLNKQLIESYHQMIDEQCLKLSSIVWIAAKSNDTAIITIIDSNKAEKIIDTFTLGNAIIYAMGSIPGVSSTDYPSIDDSKLISTGTNTASPNDVKVTPCTAASLSTGGNRQNTTETSEQVRPDLTPQVIEQNKTKYPTVWLGSSDGWLYIHSAVGEHRTTIEKVWLRHAIYSIVHVRGRVFVSLANEKVIVFHRNTDGTWNLNELHLIVTGKSRESVRCIINVGESIWCGVANRIYVFDAQTLEVRKQFDVHARPEHSVQHMTWSGDGVWLSVRLSSTLQLYHAQTYQHLQDVDVQPYVEKMIATEKAGLYFVHISALTIACRRLWIGTGNSIVISVPLTDSSGTVSSSTSTKPGSVVRVYEQMSPSNYIPYCSMTDAQLSFHGYRDAVKFFVAVPGQPSQKLLQDDETTLKTLTNVSSTDPSALAFGDILVVSGGDGYIDFRVGNTIAEAKDDVTNTNRHASYLIVWHLGST